MRSCSSYSSCTARICSHLTAVVRGLKRGLAELAIEDGTVTAFENAELVTARRA
jgi:hypothetical protein